MLQDRQWHIRGNGMNDRETGYRGIWYYNQASNDKFVYKYSGGLGTYCAKHRPFAVHRPEVNKTFFCYGGTPEGAHLNHSEEDLLNDGKFSRGREGFLIHMVSYFDHDTGQLPRPTILLDKMTADAHDNPIISIDDAGYVWIFSTSHGRSRPSYVHRSTAPYRVDSFEKIDVTRMQDGVQTQMDNFSYMQAWHIPGKGFIAFVTRYSDPVDRTLFFTTSENGVNWSEWTRLAAIGKGHYQISIHSDSKCCTAFNHHLDPQGVNWRTNLYYLETTDFGESFQNAAGEKVTLPLTEPGNPALIYDYASEDLKIYLKDIRLDSNDRPVVLYLVSKGYEAGPENGPRTLTTARWTGTEWVIHPVTESDSNYDTGSLYLETDNMWRIIAPTVSGPQPYNPGGEMAMWISPDQGRSWEKFKDLTKNSPRNHTYARSPVNANPGFYSLWADGHCRKPSKSLLYFSDRDGNVYRLPEKMDSEFAEPELVHAD